MVKDACLALLFWLTTILTMTLFKKFALHMVVLSRLGCLFHFQILHKVLDFMASGDIVHSFWPENKLDYKMFGVRQAWPCRRIKCVVQNRIWMVFVALGINCFFSHFFNNLPAPCLKFNRFRRFLNVTSKIILKMVKMAIF